MTLPLRGVVEAPPYLTDPDPADVAMPRYSVAHAPAECHDPSECPQHADAYWGHTPAEPDPTEGQGCTTCGHDGTEHSSSAGCWRRLHNGTYVTWCACEGFTSQVLA